MFGVFRYIALAVLGLTLSVTAPEAQNRFASVIQVGDSFVTRHQLDQRIRFLALLRAPGDPRELAREQLINEIIQRDAAQSIGIDITPEMIAGGMSEFAGRANLTSDQFMVALGQNGVGSETFRDFVQAGLAWREYSRARFRDLARDFPRDSVARTLARTGTEGGLRVLVSEILLPASTPETTRASQERAAELTRITSASEFAIAARQFSVASSRSQGGELPWRALETLPVEVQSIIGALSPGQTSRPVPLENAIGVFHLRDVERAESGSPENLSIDYALFFTGSADEAARVRARIDTCDDLYGEAQGLPEERLVRELQPAGALAADVRAALGRLDINETTTVVRQGAPAVLMLCSRQPQLESEVDFDLVGNRILNARLNSIAEDHLDDLRANTFVADISN